MKKTINHGMSFFIGGKNKGTRNGTSGFNPTYACRQFMFASHSVVFAKTKSSLSLSSVGLLMCLKLKTLIKQ